MRDLQVAQLLQDIPKPGMIGTWAGQRSIIQIDRQCQTQAWKIKAWRELLNSKPVNISARTLERWFCQGALAKGWPYNDLVSGAQGWWICLALSHQNGNGTAKRLSLSLSLVVIRRVGKPNSWVGWIHHLNDLAFQAQRNSHDWYRKSHWPVAGSKQLALSVGT